MFARSSTSSRLFFTSTTSATPRLTILRRKDEHLMRALTAAKVYLLKQEAQITSYSALLWHYESMNTNKLDNIINSYQNNNINTNIYIAKIILIFLAKRNINSRANDFSALD